MKEIDISHLSYDELVSLNKKIVQRLKHMNAVGSLMKVLEFDVGDKVRFTTKHGQQVHGMVTRLNKKTVSIITPEGSQWNVSPQLLQSENDSLPGDSESRKAIDINAIER